MHLSFPQMSPLLLALRLRTHREDGGWALEGATRLQPSGPVRPASPSTSPAPHPELGLKALLCVAWRTGRTEEWGTPFTLGMGRGPQAWSCAHSPSVRKYSPPRSPGRPLPRGSSRVPGHLAARPCRQSVFEARTPDCTRFPMLPPPRALRAAGVASAGDQLVDLTEKVRTSVPGALHWPRLARESWPLRMAARWPSELPFLILGPWDQRHGVAMKPWVPLVRALLGPDQTLWSGCMCMCMCACV